MFKYFLLYLISFPANVQSTKSLNKDAIDLVEFWSEEIGKELKKLSDTMTRKFKVKETFSRLKNYAYRIDGKKLVEEIADELRKIMDNKANAAQKIAEYAEYLSYHRPTNPLFSNGTYHYFNSDNFTDPHSTVSTTEMEKSMDKYMKRSECRWWCHLKDLPIMENNLIDDGEVIGYLFRNKEGHVKVNCYCKVDVPEDSAPWPFYKKMPMKYNNHFEAEVNMNFSIIKTVANVFDRDQDILEGARWTEPLDLIFKENFESDPTLTWQYFTSPNGYMRQYPATKWSSELYDQTYDMRTRSWYTEALTSPKDIVILLDKSGSTKGLKRKLGAVIVNNILDTLNDNDFVNIFLFNNTTEPLVPCFEDTLVQANEENLRLLREYLPVYSLEFCADIRIGYMKAFKILNRFKENHSSSKCNQAIMIITEQLDYDYHPEILNKMNENQNIRVFTYLLGTNQRDRIVMEDIACRNMGQLKRVMWISGPFLRRQFLDFDEFYTLLSFEEFTLENLEKNSSYHL